jgi:Lectin C-type domain/Stigma-specific protein, Stig1
METAGMRASLYRVFLSALLTALGACARSAATSYTSEQAPSDESMLDAGPSVVAEQRDAATRPAAIDANASPGRDGGAADAGALPAGSDAGVQEPAGDGDAEVATDAAGPDDPSEHAPDASVVPVEDASRTQDAALDAGMVAPEPDAGPSCEADTQLCDGACVALETNPQHCGSCAAACSAAEVCVAGQCIGGSVPPAGCTAQSFEGQSYLFCTQQSNWIAARNVCLRAQLDIVVVNSAEESAFVAGNGDSWIGATDIAGEGNWVSPVSGDPNDYSGAAIQFSSWSFAQPDNIVRCSGIVTGLPCLGPRSDEDCAMVRSLDGQWNDDDCGLVKNFVCEAL